MSDGSIKIDTIDTKGVDKGLKNLDSKLKTGKKSADNFLGSFTKFTALGAGAAIALNKVVKTVGEMTDAYKVQIKAETQLESAARNNPYLKRRVSKSSKELRRRATVATRPHGDEMLLSPRHGELAAAGKNTRRNLRCHGSRC